MLLGRWAESLWSFNNAVSLGAEKLHEFTHAEQLVLISPHLEQDWQVRWMGQGLYACTSVVGLVAPYM
jgi:hypothetical protein